ncbi:RNA-binding region-containing protein 3 [Phymastichus coffea]|uniref:RNA-binding region-containing protein 3 n=1 Tax=Phymastichus coffea TaxID=108790 RepID=UPI00273B17DA|nr:RNA-binding region-containing protein 3 [Phymastichus coffea]
MTNQTDLCTLRVLHLPPGLSNEKRDELFRHYGAVKTRTIRKSEKYTITFVEFHNKELAKEALIRLHQLPVKGRRLSIEFAKRNISVDDNDDQENLEENDAQLEQCKANYKEFMKKLNNWAPQSLFMQPIPPNIKYKYPPATKCTVLRIALQLLKEPTFYTQVLHLMNRMNIPPPFEELEEKYPIIKEIYDVENHNYLFNFAESPRDKSVFEEQSNLIKVIEQKEEEDDQEESEYESDKEISNMSHHIIPEKRKLPQSKKRMKIPKFINPLKQLVVASTSQKQRPQDVFELQTRKNKQQKLVLETLKPSVEETKSEGTSSFIVNPTGNVEGFGLIFPAKKDEEKEELREFISIEELTKNKMSNYTADKVFANYSPGNPYFKLYIKNLDKHVEESDLHYIYRRYVIPSSSKDEAEYNVKLMKDGRMKGQAFVTLQNTELAKLALQETNGYHLKDKPMVVQFSKPKE